MFLLAAITYLLSLAQIGFAYYPNFQMKWFTFSVMIVALIVLVYGFIHVVAKQLSLQTNGAGRDSWLKDSETIVRKR